MIIVELAPLILLGVCLIVLLGGVVQSLTGFGFAIVSVPLLSLLLDPKLAVVLSLLLGFLLSFIILLISFKPKKFHLKLPLLVGGFLGIFVGPSILNNVDSLILQLFIGAAGFVLAIFILRGPDIKLKHENITSAMIGIISGVLNSATSYGGVPVALFLTYQDADKLSIRINMLSYLLMANFVTLTIFSFSGLLSMSVVLFSLKLVPALIIGLFLGSWIVPRVNSTKFSQIVLIVVMITSCVAFLSALHSYLFT